MKNSKMVIFKIRLKAIIAFIMFVLLIIVNLYFGNERGIYDTNGTYVIVKAAYSDLVSRVIDISVFIIFLLYNYHIYNSIFNILNKKLDPFLAEEAHKKFFKNSKQKAKDLFYSLTEFYKGNFVNSIEITINLLNNKSLAENACLQRIMLCYYFLGEYDQARNIGEKIIENYSLRKISINERGTKEMALLVKCLIEGDMKSIQIAREIVINSHKDLNRNKILKKYLLALSYHNNNMIPESLKLLNEVVEEGNKTIFVEMAKNLLNNNV